MIDTCGYIQVICDADYRKTASDSESVVFYESVENLVADYESYFGEECFDEATT